MMQTPSQKVRVRIAAVVTGCALAYLLFAAGFCVCCLNPTTQLLAQQNSDWHTSSYTQEQLVHLAQETRAYTVEGESPDQLYGEIGYAAKTLDANVIKAKAGRTANIADMNPAETGRYLAGLSDKLSLPVDAMSHLDSVHEVVIRALWAFALCLIVSATGVSWLRLRGRRSLAHALIAADATALGLIVVGGCAALVNFDAFFAAFHSLFFTSGTWTFSADSLLICLYPEGFWTGMGIVWMTVTMLCSVAAVAAGLHIRKKA